MALSTTSRAKGGCVLQEPGGHQADRSHQVRQRAEEEHRRRGGKRDYVKVVGGTDTAKGQGKSQRPLAEYVRFATKRGMVLVYDPAPLDSWIGKAVYFDQTKKKHVDSGLPSQAKSHSLLSGPTGRGEQPSIWPRS